MKTTTIVRSLPFAVLGMATILSGCDSAPGGAPGASASLSALSDGQKSDVGNLMDSVTRLSDAVDSAAWAAEHPDDSEPDSSFASDPAGVQMAKALVAKCVFDGDPLGGHMDGTSNDNSFSIAGKGCPAFGHSEAHYRPWGQPSVESLNLQVVDPSFRALNDVDQYDYSVTWTTTQATSGSDTLTSSVMQATGTAHSQTWGPVTFQVDWSQAFTPIANRAGDFSVGGASKVRVNMPGYTAEAREQLTQKCLAASPHLLYFINDQPSTEQDFENMTGGQFDVSPETSDGDGADDSVCDQDWNPFPSSPSS